MAKNPRGKFLLIPFIVIGVFSLIFYFSAVSRAQEKPAAPSGCFTVDGQLGDWQKIKPLLIENGHYSDIPAANIRAVYAATCQGWFYLTIAVDGRADASDEVQYSVQIDTTGDDQPEWQPGFWKKGAWLWNLKGNGGYANPDNLRNLASGEYQEAIGQVAEFAMPLALLDNVKVPRIGVYTYVQVGQSVPKLANPRGAELIKVLSMDEQLAGPSQTAPTNVTPTPTAVQPAPSVVSTPVLKFALDFRPFIIFILIGIAVIVILIWLVIRRFKNRRVQK